MHIIIKFILKALSLEQASLVKVTPTANNGFTELVTLHKDKVLHIIIVECVSVFILCVVGNWKWQSDLLVCVSKSEILL